MAPPLLLSMSIEAFEAIFTARVCSPVDVMLNVLGGALGFGACGLAFVVARVHHPLAGR